MKTHKNVTGTKQSCSHTDDSRNSNEVQQSESEKGKGRPLLFCPVCALQKVHHSSYTAQVGLFVLIKLGNGPEHTQKDKGGVATA